MMANITPRELVLLGIGAICGTLASRYLAQPKPPAPTSECQTCTATKEADDAATENSWDEDADVEDSAVVPPDVELKMVREDKSNPACSLSERALLQGPASSSANPMWFSFNGFRQMSFTSSTLGYSTSRLSDSSLRFATTRRDLQVVLVRQDLNMSKGKIAAQVGHAVLACYRIATRLTPEYVKAWLFRAQAKITLKVDNEEQMNSIQAEARKAGIACCTIEVRMTRQGPMAPISANYKMQQMSSGLLDAGLAAVVR